MKLTRRQLRRLIETTVFPKNPVDYVSDPEQKKKINTLIDSDDKDNQNMGYELAIMLQDDDIDPAQKEKIKALMPPGSAMDQRMGYEGDDYLADLKSAQNKDLIDQNPEMYAMIPGLYQLLQTNEQLHDKFVNILLHPEGIELWLSLKWGNLQRLTDDDHEGGAEEAYKRYVINNKINILLEDVNDTAVLPDYLFTDPDREQIWEGNIYIYALMSTINNDKSLWQAEDEWNEISDQLSNLSGVSQMIVHFKILHFIHGFVKHTIQEIK